MPKEYCFKSGKSDLRCLLWPLRRQFHDLDIICDGGKSKVRCHKIILAAASDLLREELEGKDQIHLDATAKEVKKIIKVTMSLNFFVFHRCSDEYATAFVLSKYPQPSLILSQPIKWAQHGATSALVAAKVEILAKSKQSLFVLLSHLVNLPFCQPTQNFIFTTCKALGSFKTLESRAN